MENHLRTFHTNLKNETVLCQGAPEVGKVESSKILTQFWCLLHTSSKMEFLSARCTGREICVRTGREICVRECVVFTERDEAYGGCGLKVEINSVIRRRYEIIL